MPPRPVANTTPLHAGTRDSVLLVHGHDAVALAEVEALLVGLGIRHIVLTRITGPNQSLWQKFLDYSRETGFAIAILSPDDVGASREKYTGKDRAKALQFRARQNVILELGYFYGALGWDKVFVVHRKPDEPFPNFERPSDLDGVVFDTIDETGTWRDALIAQLRSAGFPIGPVAVVERGGAGFRTIKEAVRDAKPDTLILVCRGEYRESLVVDKPLHIVGLGGPGAVVLESDDHDTISFQAESGRLANLTIRNVGGTRSAVSISRGRPVIEGCDISCRGLSCVSVMQDAEPVIRKNRIHDGHQEGVHVKDHARGIVEENTIFRHRFAGIAIHDDAAPIVRANEVYACEQGVYIGGRGRDGAARLTVDQNTIHDNRSFGVENVGGRGTEGRNVEHANGRG